MLNQSIHLELISEAEHTNIKMLTSFNNTSVAFFGKDDKKLNQTYQLFRFMNSPWFVNVGQHLTLLAIKLRLPVKNIIKATIFNHFCGGESISDSQKTIKELRKFGISTILDYYAEANQLETDFNATVKEKLSMIDYAFQNTDIPFCVIKITGIGRFALLEKINSKINLSDEEHLEFEKIKTRMESICKSAAEKGIRVLVDAEESWIQNTIDGLAMNMMEKYNQQKPIIYNTLQMYRHDKMQYLAKIYEIAKQKEFYLGLKIVRGAYMEKERARAKKSGLPSPIQHNKEATDKDYNAAITFCISNIDKIAICAASHNENSILQLIKLLQDKGLDKKHPHIFFAQLLGMSDHITYNLSAMGYNVAKHVPYGPVMEAIPYLIRRAQENTSVSGQISRELSLIITERKRRKLA